MELGTYKPGMHEHGAKYAPAVRADTPHENSVMEHGTDIVPEISEGDIIAPSNLPLPLKEAATLPDHDREHDKHGTDPAAVSRVSQAEVRHNSADGKFPAIYKTLEFCSVFTLVFITLHLAYLLKKFLSTCSDHRPVDPLPENPGIEDMHSVAKEGEDTLIPTAMAHPSSSQLYKVGPASLRNTSAVLNMVLLLLMKMTTCWVEREKLAELARSNILSESLMDHNLERIMMNATTLELPEIWYGRGAGLFPIYSMMNTSCRNNTKSNVLPDHSLEILAKVKIKAGQEITNQYHKPDKAAFIRRQTMLCGGVVVSLEPVYNTNDWACQQCGDIVSYNDAKSIIERSESEIDNPAPLDGPVEHCERVLHSLSSTLHPGNFLLLTQKLAMMYGNMMPYTLDKMSSPARERKIQPCHDVISSLSKKAGLNTWHTAMLTELAKMSDPHLNNDPGGKKGMMARLLFMLTGLTCLSTILLTVVRACLTLTPTRQLSEAYPSSMTGTLDHTGLNTCQAIMEHGIQTLSCGEIIIIKCDLIYLIVKGDIGKEDSYHNDMHKSSYLSQHENDEGDRSDIVVIYKDLEISTLRLLKHE